MHKLLVSINWIGYDLSILQNSRGPDENIS